MSRRIAALLAAAVAAFGCAAAAAADSPTPLSPDDASALIAATGTGAVSTPSAVDSATVLAAAALPDADTAIAPDLTLDQAVGLAPTPDSSTSSTAQTTETATVSSMPKLTAKAMCWADKGW